MLWFAILETVPVKAPDATFNTVVEPSFVITDNLAVASVPFVPLSMIV